MPASRPQSHPRLRALGPTLLASLPALIVVVACALTLTLQTAFAQDGDSNASTPNERAADSGETAGDVDTSAADGGSSGAGIADSLLADLSIERWWNATFPVGFFAGLGCLFGAFLLALIIQRYIARAFERIAARTQTKIDDQLFIALRVGLRWLALIVGFFLFLRFWAEYYFTIVPDLESTWSKAFQVGLYLALFRFCWELVSVVRLILIGVTSHTDTELDDQLVPLLIKTLKVALTTLIVMMVLETVGMSVTGLVAGLGVGGLALALAAQESVQNLFGSVVIFTDRPFRVGDYISVGSVSGTVKEVGFRSTRISTREGTLVTIPNKDIAHQTIENYGLRAFRRVALTVGLTYDSTPQQIEQFVEGVRKLLVEEPLVERAPPPDAPPVAPTAPTPADEGPNETQSPAESADDGKADATAASAGAADADADKQAESTEAASKADADTLSTDKKDAAEPAKPAADDKPAEPVAPPLPYGADPFVGFDSFGDSSLNVSIAYRLMAMQPDGTANAPTYTDTLAVNQRINLALMRLVAELGLDFAFPSRTLYVKADGADARLALDVAATAKATATPAAEPVAPPTATKDGNGAAKPSTRSKTVVRKAQPQDEPAERDAKTGAASDNGKAAKPTAKAKSKSSSKNTKKPAAKKAATAKSTKPADSPTAPAATAKKSAKKAAKKKTAVRTKTAVDGQPATDKPSDQPAPADAPAPKSARTRRIEPAEPAESDEQRKEREMRELVAEGPGE